MRFRLPLKYPLVWFTLLAVLLGAAVIYLVVRRVIPEQLALSSVLSISIAGLGITAIDQGAMGLKTMLRRLLMWRVGAGYWLFALFFVPVLIVAGSFLNPVFGGQSPSPGAFKLGTEIVPMFLAFLLVAGLGQELGWTGFLTPRLQSRFSAFSTALIRAALEWVWHMPLLIFTWIHPGVLSDFPYGGWIAQAGFLAANMIMLLLFLLPWSILFVWMFNNTGGSLLLVTVLHGSEFLGAYWMIYAGIDHANLNNYLAHGLLLLLSVILIVAFSGRRNLSLHHARVGHQPAPTPE